MFSSLESRNLRPVSLFASALAHGVALCLWLARPPIYVHTSTLAWGQQGKSLNLVYFPRSAEDSLRATKPRLQIKVKRKKARANRESISEAARAGVPSGSSLTGPNFGTEARPALPLVFPDPQVYAWQLPKGLQGDVIVEVTIDEQGKVTDTRLLQSLARDIDDKVIAALRTWRFTPATVDGIAISSRQDVHFHFPS